jgi:hypothetical protein
MTFTRIVYNKEFYLSYFSLSSVASQSQNVKSFLITNRLVEIRSVASQSQNAKSFLITNRPVEIRSVASQSLNAKNSITNRREALLILVVIQSLSAKSVMTFTRIVYNKGFYLSYFSLSSVASQSLNAKSFLITNRPVEIRSVASQSLNAKILSYKQSLL